MITFCPAMTLKNSLILSCGLAAGLALTAGCAPREVPINPTPPPIVSNGYVDIEPGWRIRLVAPVTKSGKPAVALRTVGRRGNVITLATGSNLVGYEVAHYAMKARPGGGVVIRFISAEIRERKKVKRESRPLVPIFNLPPRMRFVRLVFLTRVSEHDHNQGILAATSLRRLNALTQKVETDPDQNCKAYAKALCAWVPRGMAAQPQRRDPAHRNRWVPVW